MEDEEELEKLCQESIKERIKGNKNMFWGMGYGRSTQLKHLITRLTGLDYSLIKLAIDSFDEVMGWSSIGSTRKKWDQYFIFIHPDLYKKEGYTEQFFVDQYGGLLKDYLWYEWQNGHIHKYFSKNIVTDFGYKQFFKSGKDRGFVIDSNGTYPPSQKKCRTCGEWQDI